MANVNCVKVTGISHLISEAIMKNVFTTIGDVLHYDFFPSYLEKNAFECIVKFRDGKEAQTALHLDGTEFGDRKFKVSLMGALVMAETVKAEESRASTPRSTSSTTDGNRESMEKRLRILHSDWDYLRSLNPSYCIIIRHVERDQVRIDRGSLERALNADIRSYRMLDSDNIVAELDRGRDVDRILKGRSRVDFGKESYSIDDGRYRIPKLLDKLDRKINAVESDLGIKSGSSKRRSHSRSRSPPGRKLHRR